MGRKEEAHLSEQKFEKNPTSVAKHHLSFVASGPSFCPEQRGTSPLQLLHSVNNPVFVAADRYR